MLLILKVEHKQKKEVQTKIKYDLFQNLLEHYDELNRETFAE